MPLLREWAWLSRRWAAEGWRSFLTNLESSMVAERDNSRFSILDFSPTRFSILDS